MYIAILIMSFILEIFVKNNVSTIPYNLSWFLIDSVYITQVVFYPYIKSKFKLYIPILFISIIYDLLSNDVLFYHAFVYLISIEIFNLIRTKNRFLNFILSITIYHVLKFSPFLVVGNIDCLIFIKVYVHSLMLNFILYFLLILIIDKRYIKRKLNY